MFEKHDGKQQSINMENIKLVYNREKVEEYYALIDWNKTHLFLGLVFPTRDEIG